MTLSTEEASFRYKDVQFVSLQIDHRFRYLASTVISLFGAARLLARDQPVLVFLGVLLLILAVWFLIYFAGKLCMHEELRLDFYKKETVNTWLFPLLSLLGHRKGTSITKHLALNVEDSRRIIEILYESPLTQFAEDKED